MGNGKASFQMRNEFNGYGQNTFLKATEYRTYSVLSQEDVRLTPNFNRYFQKVLGRILTTTTISSDSTLLLKVLRRLPGTNQVIIKRNPATGNYLFSSDLSADDEVTNGSYLITHSNRKKTVADMIAPYGWVQVGTSGWRWGQEDGSYLREGWLNRNEKWYYLYNYWMVTEWRQINYQRNGDTEENLYWFYFQTEKDEQQVEIKGHMVTGWRELKDKGRKEWFYFHGDGTMAVSEWISYKGSWYYQRSDGTMQKSSLREWKGKLYYLKDDGAMAVSETITDAKFGTIYYADQDGVCTLKQSNQGVNVSDFHPRLKNLQQQLITKCDNAGLIIRITESIRTVERQDELYAQGRTTSGNIVTNAKGNNYSSHHQWGTAFDFCRNDGKGAYENSDQFFEKVGKIGKFLGLEWGGDWKSPVDRPHFQLPDWGSTTRQLKQMYETPADFEKTW